MWWVVRLLLTNIIIRCAIFDLFILSLLNWYYMLCLSFCCCWWCFNYYYYQYVVYVLHFVYKLMCCLLFVRTGVFVFVLFGFVCVCDCFVLCFVLFIWFVYMFCVFCLWFNLFCDCLLFVCSVRGIVVVVVLMDGLINDVFVCVVFCLYLLLLIVCLSAFFVMW